VTHLSRGIVVVKSTSKDNSMLAAPSSIKLFIDFLATVGTPLYFRRISSVSLFTPLKAL
jgi:hypothetical protein